mgnify:CR=1 FL=1
MKFSEQQILHALSQVDDPDFKKDLVTLGMISEIAISDNKIAFKVTLTTPACPLKELIKKDCVNAIKSAFGENVVVDITMDANVTSHRNSAINVLQIGRASCRERVSSPV